MLESLRADWQVVMTGGYLNLGSSREINLERLSAYAAVVEESRAAWLTEPLGIQEHDGTRYPYSLPCRPDLKSVSLISDKAKRLMDRCQRPLLLRAPNGALRVGTREEETEFLNRICAASGCGLAIDLSALARMSRSHHFSGAEWLECIEPKNFQQLDLAGSSAGSDGWKLLRAAMSRARPRAVFVQWEGDFRGIQELEAVLERINRARRNAA